jgi:hypothetical protein
LPPIAAPPQFSFLPRNMPRYVPWLWLLRFFRGASAVPTGGSFDKSTTILAEYRTFCHAEEPSPNRTTNARMEWGHCTRFVPFRRFRNPDAFVFTDGTATPTGGLLKQTGTTAPRTAGPRIRQSPLPTPHSPLASSTGHKYQAVSRW